MAKYIAKFVQDDDMKGEVTIKAVHRETALKIAEREYGIKPEMIYQLCKVVWERNIGQNG